jgi:aryl-alcohol dehydrogenase-like predicted oxidoreductase
MEYGRIEGLEKDISRLAQGTMMFKAEEKTRWFELLDGVHALGCNAFDGAHGYGGGECEMVLGEWINERNLREKVVILDKGSHPNRWRNRVTPYDISADLHDSLARLGTEYIDIYVLHRDDPAVPVGPIVEQLNAHREEGKIRIFGGSNWTAERIAEANEYAGKHGLEPFRVSSPNYSLARQVEPPWRDCTTISGPENAGERAWYAERNFPLFTWSSLARGFLTGSITRENYKELEGTLNESTVKAYCCEENFRRLDRVRELAEKKGLSVPQIAMAWVMNQPLNIFALIGCMTPEEFKQNLEAATLKLTPEECVWLNLEDEGN